MSTRIFLTQHKDADSVTGDLVTYFVVTKLVNCLEPEIGSKLSLAELGVLILGNATVTIIGPKAGG